MRIEIKKKYVNTHTVTYYVKQYEEEQDFDHLRIYHLSNIGVFQTNKISR